MAGASEEGGGVPRAERYFRLAAGSGACFLDPKEARSAGPVAGLEKSKGTGLKTRHYNSKVLVSVEIFTRNVVLGHFVRVNFLFVHDVLHALNNLGFERVPFLQQ